MRLDSRARAAAGALLLAVALAAASLWVRANAPDRSGGVTTGRPASITSGTGERAGSWRRLDRGPGGLWVDQMAWTGTRALVFAGATTDQSKVDGARYDPRRNRWQAIARGPLDWWVGAAVAWTGRRLLVWGGCCDGTTLLADGAGFRPS